ncbi:hypothetical protein PENTCL1PPCAC_8171, partial [Pristionchus entomophagus]
IVMAIINFVLNCAMISIVIVPYFRSVEALGRFERILSANANRDDYVDSVIYCFCLLLYSAMAIYFSIQLVKTARAYVIRQKYVGYANKSH